MARGKSIKPEDKQVLIELVREEIESHERGEIDRVSTDLELSEISGIPKRTLYSYLKMDLKSEETEYRSQQLKRQAGKTAYASGLSTLTVDQLSANGVAGGKIGGRNTCRLHGPPSRLLTHEDCVAFGIKSMQVQEGNLWKNIPLGRRRAIALERIRINGNPFAQLTDEEKRVNGTKLQADYWGKLSKDERKRIQSEAYKNGIGRLSDEQRSELGRRNGKINGPKVVEAHRKNAYNVEGRFYASSQQEGAVALLLEKYVSGYNVKDGENFQVRDKRIGNGGIDFLVDGEFLEWHPIVLYSGRRGDIPEEESNVYRQIVETLNGDGRKFAEEYKNVLAVNYKNSRQHAVDNSEYTGANVSLATDIRELYDFISRYSDRLPSFDDFRREFNDEVKYVKGFKVKKEDTGAF